MFFLGLCLDTIEWWVSFSLHFAPGLYELGMQPRKCRFRLLLYCLILGVYVQLDDVPDGTSKKGIDMSGGLCIPSSGFGTRPAPRMRSPPPAFWPPPAVSHAWRVPRSAVSAILCAHLR